LSQLVVTRNLATANRLCVNGSAQSTATQNLHFKGEFNLENISPKINIYDK